VNRLKTFCQIVKHFGWGWVGYRLFHVLIHKTGHLERQLPAIAWDDLKPEEWLNIPSLAQPESLAQHRGNVRTRFLFDPVDRATYRDTLRGFDAGNDWARGKIEAIERGELSFFSNDPIQVGFPPRWNDNLLEDRPGPALEHFAHLNEFASGDVKCIWEPNRFAFAYDLVRAYWRTGDERAPQLFWAAAEDWIKHNPPNTGINWKCGQESTFRAMAWCFALWGFSESPATTPQRHAMAAKLMAATARRIEPHLRYALSQKNNHGISEAMGLFTIGLLFPELKGSTRWVEKGEKHLEGQARELIYDDGAFSQNSANYHRVMLHDYLYAIRIGELNGRPLSESLVKRVAKAGRFLFKLQDATSGRVPRYGQDDGAMILPLSNQPYDDYRPVVQTTCAVTGTHELPWHHGPWDEASLWLLGPKAVERSAAKTANDGKPDPQAHAFSAPYGGCHIIRNAHGMAAVRAQTYRHRPAQLDQLHTDIWWRGQNIALDPGTYSYNGDAQWAAIPLALTHAHNTPTARGKEQAGRAGRFMFLPWPIASAGAHKVSDAGHITSLTAKHDWGKGRIDQRQLIRLGPEHWLILDTLCSLPGHIRGINWNLMDAPHQWDTDANRIGLALPAGDYSVQVGQMGSVPKVSLMRAGTETSRGWYSPRYQAIEPCLSVCAEVSASTRPALPMYSAFGPGPLRVEAEDNKTLSIYHEHGAVTIGFDADMQANQITLSGTIEDHFRVGRNTAGESPTST